MALVDPRILENIQPQLPSRVAAAAAVGSLLRRIGDEMLDTTTFRFTLEGKVAFYNQVLNRYNDFADKRRQEPQRVVVNKAYNNEENKVEQENKIETSIENEMIDSVPKAMKQKARRLLDKIKCVAVWNDRVELVYRNNAVYRSNIVDLVNDVLRKRKSSCLCWGLYI